MKFMFKINQAKPIYYLKEKNTCVSYNFKSEIILEKEFASN